jgi:hypothetical protein
MHVVSIPVLEELSDTVVTTSETGTIDRNRKTEVEKPKMSYRVPHAIECHPLGGIPT